MFALAILVLQLRYMVESPIWLARKERVDEAAVAMTRIYGQPFTAAMPEQPQEEAYNPLVPASSADAAPASAPAPALPPLPEPPAADPVQSSAPAPAPDPVMPDADDTLADIEQAVHSPHVAQAAEVGDARNAVTDALNAAPYDPSRPEPLQSLNASPLGTPSEEPQIPAPAEPSTQDVFPLPQPADMFASHNSGTPQFPVPEQPGPQQDQAPEPETQSQPRPHKMVNGALNPEGAHPDEGTPPPPVPPPMMPV